MPQAALDRAARTSASLGYTYRGLLACMPEHRRLLFGRDREIAEICGDPRALEQRRATLNLAVARASGAFDELVLADTSRTFDLSACRYFVLFVADVGQPADMTLQLSRAP